MRKIIYKMHKIVIEPKDASLFRFRYGKTRMEQKTYTMALQNPSDTQIKHVPKDLSTVLNRNRKIF